VIDFIEVIIHSNVTKKEESSANARTNSSSSPLLKCGATDKVLEYDRGQVPGLRQQTCTLQEPKFINNFI